MVPKFVIYTDGACEPNPGFGGWAAILLYTDSKNKILSRHISGNATETTNNRMEIMAVLAALKRLKFPSHITVYSDSKYVVNAVGDWCNGEPVPKKIGWMVRWRRYNWVRPAQREVDRELKNKDLWQDLHGVVIKQASVTMRWVRGHSGNKYNEICDVLAVEERIKAANGILVTGDVG